MSTHEYWVLVRNDHGTAIRVVVYAENPHRAMDIARSLYGRDLISEGANFIK